MSFQHLQDVLYRGQDSYSTYLLRKMRDNVDFVDVERGSNIGLAWENYSDDPGSHDFERPWASLSPVYIWRIPWRVSPGLRRIHLRVMFRHSDAVLDEGGSPISGTSMTRMGLQFTADTHTVFGDDTTELAGEPGGWVIQRLTYDPGTVTELLRSGQGPGLGTLAFWIRSGLGVSTDTLRSSEHDLGASPEYIDHATLTEDWSEWGVRTQSALYTPPTSGTPPIPGGLETSATAVGAFQNNATTNLFHAAGFCDHVLRWRDNYMITHPRDEDLTSDGFVPRIQDPIATAVRFHIPYVQFRGFQVWEEYDARR